MSQPPHQVQLAQGFAQAKHITRIHASTFYFASRFLPSPVRDASYSVYAVCRKTDDAVDAGSGTEPKDILSSIRKGITSAYAGNDNLPPLLAAFRHTVEEYGIPAEYFYELIKGMEMDITENRYEHFDRLYLYCYRVAAIIGLIMLKIFRDDTEKTREPAINLGIAMQLTNIIRDIEEDYRRGRIYLPQKELEQFGVTEGHLRKKIVDENFVALVRFQIDRAQHFYRKSESGITRLTSRRQRYVVRAMKEIYAGILSAVERNRYDVFSQRAHVSKTEKCKIALFLLVKGACS